MKFFWDKRPAPRFGKTGFAIIADKKTARYLLIKKRWWDCAEKEWMYEGAELIIKSDILTVVARDQLYAESDLIPVRGL